MKKMLLPAIIAAVIVPMLSHGVDWSELKANPHIAPAITNRTEALAFFAENVYGARPERTTAMKEKVLESVEVKFREGVEAVRKTIEIDTMTPLGPTKFRAVAYFPKGIAKAPVFVYVSFHEATATENPRWPIGAILKRGAATVGIYYNDVLKDDAKVFGSIKRAPNACGAISTWSFAASRVMDYLETEPLADVAHVAIVGHSRLGKTSLWTGANDTRFAMACVNDSGCFGARLHAMNISGETIGWITGMFPHWFAPKCREQYRGKDYELPFDQHSLLMCVAPRILCVGSADGDWWACPSGEFAGWLVAANAWKNKEAVDYHVRHGIHDITLEDWNRYLDVAKRNGWRCE